MSKRIYLLCCCVFMGLGFASSQPQQTAIWYFGHNAGIEFVNGNPVALSNGQINNVEGCAVQSDHYGNLLFYTDGVTIWDRNHNPMPNGTALFGNASTTQSLIVQKPGDCRKYYVFYQSGQVDLQAYYSIVDMNLNGGLGDVVPASKNTFLYYPATEKITSVLHQNGTDTWVIMHEMNTNKFMAYQLTPAGLNPPVYSNSGPVHDNMIGYMKASHNGSRLAVAVSFGISQAGLFDFDRSTGMVSNPFLFTGWVGPYGLEFSPGDSLLYVSTFWSTNTLYQVDLINNNIQTLATSNIGNYDFGALQLGPNGKIYMVRGNQNYLCAINDPDIVGLGCNYQNSAVMLAPGTTGAAGLPTFNQALFDYLPASFSYVQSNCAVYDFAASIPVIYDSLSWNFGDINSGTNNTSHTPNAQHQFSATGTYTVTLIIFTGCYNDTVQQQLNAVSSISNSLLGNDTTLCQGTSLLLDAGPGFSQYLWQDGSTGQTLTATLSGMYSVTVTGNNGCMAYDSILVSIVPAISPPDLGNDTVICGTLVLDAGSGHPGYSWQDGSTGQTFVVTTSGTYSVSVVTPCGIFADSIYVTVHPLPQLNLGSDTSMCLGSVLNIDAGSGFASYLWQDHSTSQVYAANAQGLFSVTVSDTSGCLARDTILVTWFPVLTTPNIGNDTSFCPGTSLVLDAGPGYPNYLWQDSSSGQTFTVVSPGVYTVSVTDQCGTVRDSIIITYNTPPWIDLGNDRILCPGAVITLDAGGGMASYLWQDASTQPSLTVNAAGTYSVTVTDHVGCSSSDQVNINAQQTPVVDLGADGDLCQSPQFMLDAGPGNVNYIWQDGSAQQTYVVTSGGEYSVTVSNSCGVASDTAYFAPCPDCIIDLPNAFTPNGDGQNDVLYVLGSGYTNMQMIIYDRHGVKVFETTDPSVGWDGYYKGVKQENEIYYFYLKADCPYGQTTQKKGDITLVN